MNEWRDFLECMVYPFAAIVILVSLLCGTVLLVSNHIDHVDCLRLSEQTGLSTKATKSGFGKVDCYIRIDSGQWIPADRYRGVMD